jgi:hypothetical protein
MRASLSITWISSAGQPAAIARSTGEQALDEPLRAFPSWFLRRHFLCDERQAWMGGASASLAVLTGKMVRAIRL